MSIPFKSRSYNWNGNAKKNPKAFFYCLGLGLGLLNVILIVITQFSLYKTETSIKQFACVIITPVRINCVKLCAI